MSYSEADKERAGIVAKYRLVGGTALT